GLKEFTDPALVDLVRKMTVHAVQRISEITRRDCLGSYCGRVSDEESRVESDHARPILETARFMSSMKTGAVGFGTMPLRVRMSRVAGRIRKPSLDSMHSIRSPASTPSRSGTLLGNVT